MLKEIIYLSHADNCKRKIFAFLLSAIIRGKHLPFLFGLLLKEKHFFYLGYYTNALLNLATVQGKHLSFTFYLLKKETICLSHLGNSSSKLFAFLISATIKGKHLPYSTWLLIKEQICTYYLGDN